MIQGAGVLLWREKIPLSLEVALIHRAKYDDWSFPKGKVEPSENLIQAAHRECLEETGIITVIGPYLGEAEYQENGESKVIHYWMAKPSNENQDFQKNEEVDQLVWMTVKEARHFLTYESDRELLSRFIKVERHVRSLIFRRHAKAVKRDDWLGEDSDRPLSHVGEMQVAKLGSIFKPFGVEEVHASDAQRCLSTALVVAQALRVECKSTASLSEDVFEKDDNVAIEYVQQLIKLSKNVVVCSHNPIFSEMLLAFENSREFSKNLPGLSPADSWVIHYVNSRIVAIDTVAAPPVEKTS